MADPFKEGAAVAFGVRPEEVTRDQRTQFKRGYFETWWLSLRENAQNRRATVKQVLIIEQGVRDGWADDRIKTAVIAAADA